MVSRKVVASLLLVYVVAMLAEQTEGYLAFFTRSDIERMQLQEKERNKAQRKSLMLQKRSEGGDVIKFSDTEGVDGSETIKLTAPGESRIRLSAKQMEKYQHTLEELLTEMLLDTQNETNKQREDFWINYGSSQCHEACFLIQHPDWAICPRETPVLPEKRWKDLSCSRGYLF